jgi:Fe-S-cluster containining protein
MNVDGSETEHSLCSDCNGACCRKNIALPLTAEQAKQLSDAGTAMLLMTISEIEGHEPGRGRNFYKFLSDCANLDPDSQRCMNYGNRPDACRDFEAGGYLCQVMRRREGIDVYLPMPTLRSPT